MSAQVPSSSPIATESDMDFLALCRAADRSGNYVSPGALLDCTIILRKLPNERAMRWIEDFSQDTRDRLLYIMAGNAPTLTRDRFTF